MLLVGGFNPFEKYQSNWESSPDRGENKEYLKPPRRLVWMSMDFSTAPSYRTCSDANLPNPS